MPLKRTGSKRPRNQLSPSGTGLLAPAILLTATLLGSQSAVKAGPAQTVNGDSEILGNQSIRDTLTVGNSQTQSGGNTLINGDLTVTGQTNIKGLTVNGNQIGRAHV